MARGHDRENELAAEIEEGTVDEVSAYRIGYSGNSKLDDPDVLVTTPQHNAAIELKNAAQGWRYIDSEELEDVPTIATPTTIAFLVVKFTYYEPLVVRYFPKVSEYEDEEGREWEDLSISEQFAELIPEGFDPHVTEEGNLRLTHPKETDDFWTATGRGRSDGEAVANGIGALWDES